jgi:glucose-1-phosphate thymidylyltransferase
MFNPYRKKGILLAGGTGSRLFPMTRSVSKQLLPVFDKPMVYYPLCTLMMAGLRDIIVITTARDAPAFEGLLGDGRQWGLTLSYAVQDEPRGIAEALLIGERFLEGQGCALALGDNLFYGQGLTDLLRAAADKADGATIFGYSVPDPRRYGVVEINSEGQAISIEEKPARPRSSYAITGLYFYDGTVCEKAHRITPSNRKELEISCLNQLYMEAGALDVSVLGRGCAWFDTGTPSSLLQASQFVEAIEKRQGQKICCPEEVALAMGYLEAESVARLAEDYGSSEYGEYLRFIAGVAGPAWQVATP